MRVTSSVSGACQCVASHGAGGPPGSSWHSRSDAWRSLLAGCVALVGMSTPAPADQLGVTDRGAVIEALADVSSGREAEDALTEPVGRAVVRSSRMEAAPARRVSLGEETWTISHARNPSGSFLLVRNMSPPGSEEVLSVSLGAAPEQALAARETSTWDCGALEGNAILLVRAATGDAVFAGEVACGDAVTLRSSPAP